MKYGFISTLDDYWGGSEELWFRLFELVIKSQKSSACLLYNRLASNSKFDSYRDNIFGLPSDNQIIKSSFPQRLIHFSKRKIAIDYKLRKWKQIDFDQLIISQGDSFEVIANSDFYDYLMNFEGHIYIISQLNFEHKPLGQELIIKARELYTKAQKVIFVSKRNWEVAQHQLAMPLINGYVIDNPLNLKSLDAIHFPSADGIVHFASVARLDTTFKGQDLLIQVLSSAKWKSRSWKLHFYGQGTDLYYLQELVKYYALVQFVIFEGHLKDIRDVWRVNHVLLMPSIAEGKPLALQEAMICGRPAVVTDVAGNAELIKDEETGFVARASTVELIDEALERAWQQKSNWPKIGLKAHKWAMQNIDLTPEETLFDLITSFENS